MYENKTFKSSLPAKSTADEVLRLHQVGRARLGSLQADGVGSEETWHQGRPLDESPHAASPPHRTPHVHGHSVKREIDLRRTQAESACADGGLTARATRCPDCPHEAAVCKSTCLELSAGPAVGGLEAGRPRWMKGTAHPPRSWRSLMDVVSHEIKSSDSMTASMRMYPAIVRYCTAWKVTGGLQEQEAGRIAGTLNPTPVGVG
ncbi:hypothetical protein Efla_000539 [Eimeria flavescens]